MKLTCLDLEMNQPSGKIVQIGAVIGDTQTGEIVDRIRIYVNPGEPVAEFITELCGITQQQIDAEGVSLEEAYLQLKKFHKQANFINPVSWGGGDSQEIYEQLSEDTRKSWCFGRRWIDAKTVFVSQMIAHQNHVESSGLSASMKRVGLQFAGRQHDAQDDAENTFKMYQYMLNSLREGRF